MEVLKHYNAQTHLTLYEYNTTIKTYANGKKKIKYNDYSTFKGNCRFTSNSLSENTKDSREYSKYKNLYKTKQSIIDLVYHNGIKTPWEYFVTLTFDDNIVDGKCYESVSTALHLWLDNMKHQNKKMEYVIAPEPHPKSGRIHYHGIFKNVPNWNLVEARHPISNRLIKKSGLQIYNLTNYKYGFTTVSKVNDLEAISVYISKYITKNLIDLSYRKKYWCSQNLERPNIKYAHFNEETLKFYLKKHNIVSFKEVQKENCKSIFIVTS